MTRSFKFKRIPLALLSMIYVAVLLLIANYGAWTAYYRTEAEWFAEFMRYFSESMILAGIYFCYVVADYVYPKVK